MRGATRQVGNWGSGVGSVSHKGFGWREMEEWGPYGEEEEGVWCVEGSAGVGARTAHLSTQLHSLRLLLHLLHRSAPPFWAFPQAQPGRSSMGRFCGALLQCSPTTAWREPPPWLPAKGVPRRERRLGGSRNRCEWAPCLSPFPALRSLRPPGGRLRLHKRRRGPFEGRPYNSAPGRVVPCASVDASPWHPPSVC